MELYYFWINMHVITMKSLWFWTHFFQMHLPPFQRVLDPSLIIFHVTKMFCQNNYTITKIHINCNLQTKIYKYVKIVMKTDRWILKTCPSARVDTIYKIITLNFSNRAINLYFIRFLFLCLFCHFDRSWRLQHPLYQNMAVNNWQVTNIHV